MQFNLIYATILAISIGFNLFFFWQKRTKKPEASLDAKQLLHDLFRGSAVVKIEVIDPTDLLIYRGK